MFLVVDKAPANLVHQSTGDVLAVLPETGVYFSHYTDSDYVSSLSIPAKSEIVPIPGELTNIIGGYYRTEKVEPLIDAIIPSGSFELHT